MIAMKVCFVVHLFLLVRTVNGLRSLLVFTGIYVARDQFASADFNYSCAFHLFLSAFPNLTFRILKRLVGFQGLTRDDTAKQERDVHFSVRFKVLETSRGDHPLCESICIFSHRFMKLPMHCFHLVLRLQIHDSGSKGTK